MNKYYNAIVLYNVVTKYLYQLAGDNLFEYKDELLTMQHMHDLTEILKPVHPNSAKCYLAINKTDEAIHQYTHYVDVVARDDYEVYHTISDLYE